MAEAMDKALAEEIGVALRHHQAGRLDEAVRLYDRLLERAPGHPDLLNLSGVLNAQRGDNAEAVRRLRAAAAAAPENSDIRFNLAQALDRNGDAAGAALAYAAVLARLPDHVPSLCNLARGHLAADRYSEAARLFARAAASAPTDAAILVGQGAALARARRHAEARQVLEKALSIRPNDPLALANLCGTCISAGDADAALAAIRKAIALEPSHGDFRTSLGVALCLARDFAAAITAFDEALRLDPYNARALATKGVAMAELGDRAGARRIFDYAKLVVSRRIASPAAYADLAAFNRALVAEVTSDPTLIEDRPGETTVGGGQTEDLVPRAQGAVRALIETIAAAAKAYFAEKAGAAKPFPHPVPPRFRLVAWATVLRSQGHQDPHNHPAAILSGVYYAQIPAVIGKRPGDRSGFIEFGRAAPEFRLHHEPEIFSIKPEEGLLVLFPSAYWHDTVPFESDSLRISIAFDLVPLR